MTFKIAPYHPASESARGLSQATGYKRLKVNGASRWRPRADDVVVNWGRSSFDCFDWDETPRVLNAPAAVDTASNKYRSARTFEDNHVSTPDWTDNPDIVFGWLNEGYTVLARTLLRASGGRGIVKLDHPEVDIPRAPMYTKYVPKISEWRVHVWQGRTLSIQRKIAKPDVVPADWQIRNHENGFIFQQDWNPNAWHDELEEESYKAVTALGLDFGAVDVIWNDRMSRAFVLEVNTASGLTGNTLEKYVEILKND